MNFKLLCIAIIGLNVLNLFGSDRKTCEDQGRKWLTAPHRSDSGWCK